MLTYLEETKKDQFRLLESLILQESHTLDKEGVDKVGQLITSSLTMEDIEMEVVPVSERGDHLVFRSRACQTGEKPILLAGHMDTVFPKGSSFNYYRDETVKAYGPGIIDMKGGLVTAIFALKALDKIHHLSKIPLVFICNSDEEMGSLFSRELIATEAKRSLCGLVFECGGLNGETVTGRKGKVGYRLEIKGKAGHAAFTNNKPKASAVLELAHKTIQLEALNDPGRQIVVNVGHVQGGDAANVVAERATAEIDTRFLSKRDSDVCYERIKNIAANSTVPDTQGGIEVISQRPPMEQSAANHSLFSIFQEQADLLSLPIAEELRSGVSDANSIAACHIPVIDGLGPMGDLDHSDKEYMIKESLLTRCQLTALGILSIWQKQRNKSIF